jgi:hypothetical protein
MFVIFMSVARVSTNAVLPGRALLGRGRPCSRAAVPLLGLPYGIYFQLSAACVNFHPDGRFAVNLLGCGIASV